jgi:hypothetical protein
MVSVRKIYNYPAHAVDVFYRVMSEHLSLGRSLHSLSKGYLLGTGVSLRFEFAESPDKMDHKLIYFYGRRRDDLQAKYEEWQIDTVLPMKIFWVSIGHFYLLKRVHENAA